MLLLCNDITIQHQMLLFRNVKELRKHYKTLTFKNSYIYQ